MNIGPHLLGRRRSPQDHRDFKLSAYLPIPPLDAALAKLVADRSTPASVTEWATTITSYLKGHAPTPPKPPPMPAISWDDTEPVLDQGDTPHCVGFGWAQWGNTAPVNDGFRNSDGNAIYYECKIIDGQPGQENGSDVRSGAKAMQNRGRLSAYAFAASADEAREFVRIIGPIVVGTDWTQSMFEPDAAGFVRPTGATAGGHCYLLVGDLPAEGALLFQNSWGRSWGMSGRFKMKYADFAKLFARDGEACAAVELPVVAR
jgi:Papain family cysteine protease